MAELGAVANGIALATIVFQVGDGLLRFKRFWENVNSAPEDISYLLEEIEAQYLVISDISNQRNGMDMANISATNCFHLYQRTASTLEKLVNELEKTIREKKILGGIKTTLKKGTVNELRERLRNVQGLLLLSNQVYLGTLQKQYHEKLVQLAIVHRAELQSVKQKVERSLESTEFGNANQDTESLPAALSKPTNGTNFTRDKNKETVFGLRTLPWLLNRGWELRVARSISGWNIRINSYRIIPFDSPATDCIGKGDIQGLQALFSEGRALPNDRLIERWPGGHRISFTLLDYAAIRTRSHICRLLMEQGADPNDSEQGLGNTMASALVNVGYVRLEGLEKVAFQDTISCLAEKADVPDGSYCLFRGDHETLRFLLKIHAWDKLCSRSRIQMALHLASLPEQCDMANLVRAALNDVPISREISGACDPAGRTLLQFAAQGLLNVLDSISSRWGILDHALGFDTGGNAFFKSEATGKIFEDTLLNGHLRYIRDLIMADASLYPHTSNPNNTNHGSLIRLALGLSFQDAVCACPCQVEEIMNVVLRVWLRQLQICNVDLQNYGEREYKLFCSRSCEKLFMAGPYSPGAWHKRAMRRRGRTDFYVRPIVRLISFNYGPQLDDWKIFTTEEFPSLFLDFWTMIDHPERAIPGAWECCDDQDFDYSPEYTEAWIPNFRMWGKGCSCVTKISKS